MTGDQSNHANGRAIVTYGRSLMALTAAHSLCDHGVEVIGCDSVDLTVMQFSKCVSENFVHAPYKDDVDEYLNDLVDNIKKYKPDDGRPYVLMPMFKDLTIIAEHKERFDGLIDVITPPLKSIGKVESKSAFSDTAAKLGLTIPRTDKPQSLEELGSLKDKLEFPCLIKPQNDVGGRGIEKAENFDELCSLFERSLEHYGTAPLVQEVIDGEDYCLAVICKNGEILSHMAYHNLKQFPARSGAGVIRETIDDSVFLDAAKKLMKELNWHGVAQIDFRWNDKKKDSAYLIEVNPRFWAGLFHSVESGVNFPWMLYQLASTGKVSDKNTADVGTKTRTPGLWMLSTVQDIAQNDIHIDKLKEALLSNKTSKDWKKRLAFLKEALSDTVDEKGMLERLKSSGIEARESKSELDMDDDHFISLGALFIISSIIRHGELPDELK